MAIDPMLPYGEVRESTVRVATWNTWSQFGPWEQREPVLLAELARVRPDIVCLQEAWKTDDDSQAARVGAHLGMESLHLGDGEYEGVVSGHGIISRWPIVLSEKLEIPAADGGDGAGAAFARIEGPREPIDVVSLILDWRLDHSHIRSRQLQQICEWARDLGDRFHPLILCGDFNSTQECDELRPLLGLAPVYAPNMVFYDAVGMCATGDAATYSSRNPFAAIGMYPERQLDHIFSQWPKAHGVGHPVHAEIIGTDPGDVFASDHFGVVADLRY